MHNPVTDHLITRNLIVHHLIIPAGYEAVFKQFVEKTYADNDIYMAVPAANKAIKNT